MLTIHDTFKNLLPSLSKGEYEKLEQSIVSEGCRDPLVLWAGVLIDGHNRYSICQKHNITYRTADMDFESESDAMLWIARNQLGRRNLTDAQRVNVALQLKPAIEAEKKKRQGTRNDLQSNIQENFPECSKNDDKKTAPQTRDEVGEIAGVSGKQVDKVEDVLENGDDEVKEKMLAGDISIHQAHKKTRQKAKREEKERKREELVQKALSLPQATESFDVILGDCIEVMSTLDDCSVDFIITDPPYPKEYLPLYEDLAKSAKRILKPGGSMLVMCGQSYLPEIIAMMSKYMTYQWMLSYLTPGGQSVQLWARNVNTFWKPVLWYVNGDYDGNWVGDVCKSDVNDNDKNNHKWGQSVSGMMSLMGKFLSPGAVILDPFCGAGTTGICTIELGGFFIGIDNDNESIEITKARLHEASQARAQ